MKMETESGLFYAKIDDISFVQNVGLFFIDHFPCELSRVIQVFFVWVAPVN